MLWDRECVANIFCQRDQICCGGRMLMSFLSREGGGVIIEQCKSHTHITFRPEMNSGGMPGCLPQWRATVEKLVLYQDSLRTLLHFALLRQWVAWIGQIHKLASKTWIWFGLILPCPAWCFWPLLVGLLVAYSLNYSSSGLTSLKWKALPEDPPHSLCGLDLLLCVLWRCAFFDLACAAYKVCFQWCNIRGQHNPNEPETIQTSRGIPLG